MKELAHHKYVSPFKPDHLEKRVTFWTERFASAARKGEGSLATAPGTMLDDAGLAYSLKSFPIAKRLLILGAEAGAAACATSFRTGDVSITFDGTTSVATGSVPRIALSPSTWMANCFDFVLFARRKDLLSLVLEYPAEYLRKAGGERDEFGFTLVEALRAFGSGQPTWKDLAAETERNMEPDRAKIAPTNWIAMYRARIGILRAIDQGTTEALDASLVAMIKAHKVCKGRGDEAKGAGSLLCMPALALGALAHDRGIRTTVVSDYMPLWLLRGEDPPA